MNPSFPTLKTHEAGSDFSRQAGSASNYATDSTSLK